ncbi:MAG: hypothetical protein BEN19_02530 [Epulopiscium sp. Nuni2H_MBin003]|nr:MAG: hypothetical protein BEN19_02530 [Epulopiscium sp. Nuni2H_MBin003]
MRLLIFVFTLFLSTNIFANTLDVIRVGVVSVYKDATNITIRSDENIKIGYLQDNNFIELARLDDNLINISLVQQQYYTDNNSYATYNAALNAANLTNGKVAYISPDNFLVYYTEINSSAVYPLDTYIEISDSQNKVILIANYNQIPLVFEGTDNDYAFPVMSAGENKYRGVLEVVQNDNGLTLVNTVGIEEYLFGVVPYEVSAYWPTEALKAQAVVARSVANFQSSRYLAYGYNIVDTTYAQVYKGVVGEDIRTTTAVLETIGEVVIYNDKIAETLYFAASGGYTANAEDVWGNAVPYLVAVPDIYETSPTVGEWQQDISFQELESVLEEFNIGNLKQVKIVQISDNGRVTELQFVGDSGQHSVYNEATRTFFSRLESGSLKSQLYTFGESSQQFTYDNTIDVQSSSDKEEMPMQQIFILGIVDKDLSVIEGDEQKNIIESTDAEDAEQLTI